MLERGADPDVERAAPVGREAAANSILVSVQPVQVQVREIEVPTIVVIGAPLLFLAVMGGIVYLLVRRTRTRAMKGR